MTVLRAEFEQKFSKVLRSRAATAPRGVMRALDPHPERRPEQDGRSPPRCRRRDLSPGSERLSRRPGPLGQRLEVHHTGVDPGPLEQLPAENTARLTTPPARTGRHRSGATARSTGKSTPIPALCRPPTSHWRAGARVDVGRPHQRLEQSSQGNSPTPRLALRFVCCECRSVADSTPLSAPQEGNYS